MKKMRLFVLFSLFIVNFVFSQESLLVPFLKGKKFGFVDENKNIIIEPKFTNAYPFGYYYDEYFGPDYALVQIETDMFFVDRKGNLTEEVEFKKNYISNYKRPPQKEELKTFSYSVFERNGKKGLQDENKKVLLKPIYKYLDIYSFSESYYDKKSRRSYKPTYANVTNNEKSEIIRIDKFKVYENIHLASFRANSNHLIVWIKNSNNGILINDKLITIALEYKQINKFYPEQGLISVDKIIDNYPVSLYIDLKGNEFYEK